MSAFRIKSYTVLHIFILKKMVRSIKTETNQMNNAIKTDVFQIKSVTITDTIIVNKYVHYGLLFNL